MKYSHLKYTLRRERIMIILKILFVLCSVECLVHGDSLLFNRFASDTNEEVVDRWITQPLDHFNCSDKRTWSMRYKENSVFSKNNSLILIMIGGQGPITNEHLKNGLMYDIGVKHGGMMYYVEHRFYGKSRPTEDMSTNNLKYLSTKQTLRDLQFFIKTKKKEYNLQNNRIILFGCSYAGNLAVALYKRFPGILGILASSAPIHVKLDFYEYYESVAKALRTYNENCSESVKTAFALAEKLFTTQDDLKTLKSLFNLCDVPKYPLDRAHFMKILAQEFANAVQYDQIKDGQTKIAALCNKMTENLAFTPLQRLAYIFWQKSYCNDVSYNNYVNKYREISWDLPIDMSINRLWYYQKCTEYGYFQMISNNTVFGTSAPLSYFVTLCNDLFDIHLDENILYSQVQKTKESYEKYLQLIRNQTARKIIFTNGDIDPWYRLSLSDINHFSHTIIIKGASHCRDLLSEANTDPDNLKEARARIRSIIDNWITLESDYCRYEPNIFIYF